ASPRFAREGPLGSREARSHVGLLVMWGSAPSLREPPPPVGGDLSADFAFGEPALRAGGSARLSQDSQALPWAALPSPRRIPSFWGLTSRMGAGNGRSDGAPATLRRSAPSNGTPPYRSLEAKSKRTKR